MNIGMLWALLIGLFAGVGSGLFGIGGGIIIVPALILCYGMTQQTAQGTSLVALLMPVGILGVMNYYQKGMIDLTKGGLIAMGVLAGAYFGSKIAVGVDPVVMRRMFAGFLVVVAAYIFFRT